MKASAFLKKIKQVERLGVSFKTVNVPPDQQLDSWKTDTDPVPD